MTSNFRPKRNQKAGKRGERFVSRAGDSVFVEPGEQPQAPGRDAAGPVDLARIRRELGITQSDLASWMQVDQAQVSRLESRGDFRVSTVLEYLRGLGVTDVALLLKFRDGNEINVPVRSETSS